jgi:NlpE N-terminal domain
MHFLPARRGRCKMAATIGVRPTMRRRLILTILVCDVLLGCGRGGSKGEPAVTPQPGNVAGVYAGSFACSNCKEIDATLWLRADERFFLRQSYMNDGDTAEEASYAFGHWSWDEHAAEIVLRGRGPDRHLKQLDADRLEWLGNAAAKTVFGRNPSAPPFADRVRLDGESAVTEHGATFKQCVTGLELRIADAGAFKELRRQQHALNPTHKVALTTVDAHIVNVAGTATSEQLVIDKVIGLKPGAGC